MIRPHRGAIPKLGLRVFVDQRASVIGAVDLGDDASVWPGAVIRGDMGQRIVVGARTSVQDNAVLHITHAGPYTGDGYSTFVGNDVTIGHGAILHACQVGDRVLIGMGSIVLDGAIIEDEVMLGAGSLVSPGKRLQSGHLYRGAPAQLARPLTDTERTQLQYMANNYVRLKDEYRSEGS